MDIQEVVNIVDMCTFGQMEMQRPMTKEIDEQNIASLPTAQVDPGVALPPPTMTESTAQTAPFKEIIKPLRLLTGVTDITATGGQGTPSPDLRYRFLRLLLDWIISAPW